MPWTLSTFTPERASEVICRLSGGRSLWSVCRDPDMPAEDTVRRWARQDPAFAAGLEAARTRGRRGDRACGRRPSKYSPELAKAICAALAEGFSLTEICASPAAPVAPTTVRGWVRRRPDFARLYAEATRPRQGPDGRFRVGRGRRGGYTPERAQAVIDRLLQGRALADIARDPDMPSRKVIDEWRRRHMDFHLRMQAARRFQLDLLMEEMLAAADDGFTAGKAAQIAGGLAARGVRAMGAGEAGPLGEDVAEVEVGPTPTPGRAERKARRVGAPGIGHNSRGR